MCMNTHLEIGPRIRAARELCNMSAKKLAKRARLSEEYISRLELQKIKNPGIVTIERIADALEIPFADLVFGERMIPESGFDGDIKIEVSRKQLIMRKRVYVTIDITD